MLSKLDLRFSGNDQEILCALGKICHSETLDKESFSRVAKFYKLDSEILEAEEKMYASFRRARGLGYMSVPEMLETIHENDLFDRFPSFSNVVHILGVIPATLYVFCRTIIQCVAQIENLPPHHHGQHCVSNIAVINIERAYANSVVNNDMDRIIAIFGSQNGKDSHF